MSAPIYGVYQNGKLITVFLNHKIAKKVFKSLCSIEGENNFFSIAKVHLISEQEKAEYNELLRLKYKGAI